jgi:hypothetical protein
MAMSPGINNHGGGVDSGGAGTDLKSLVQRLQDVLDMWVEKSLSSGLNSAATELLNGAASALPDLHRLLTKSLCTLQALVSNMEESGEGVEQRRRWLR